MWEQVELLEHHPDLRADFLDVLDVIRKLYAINDDGALLMRFKPVDTANPRRLAGSRWSDDDDHLPLLNRCRHAFERLEVSKPLLDSIAFDDRVAESSRSYFFIIHSWLLAKSGLALTDAELLLEAQADTRERECEHPVDNCGEDESFFDRADETERLRL